MGKFECLDYCEYNFRKPHTERKKLFGYSQPPDDYFNDNLDQFYDEDDYFDYTESLEGHVDLEDKTYTHSHKAAH